MAEALSNVVLLSASQADVLSNLMFPCDPCATLAQRVLLYCSCGVCCTRTSTRTALGWVLGVCGIYDIAIAIIRPIPIYVAS
jgi:hypothetical protein